MKTVRVQILSVAYSGVAQLAVHSTRNREAAGSKPVSGSYALVADTGSPDAALNRGMKVRFLPSVLRSRSSEG